MTENNAHQYTGCRLERVFLLNGFEAERNGHATRCVDSEKLHRQITAALVNQPHPLDRDDLRFLRERLDLTQYELSRLLECGGQDVCYWEMGVKSPGLMRELALRVLASTACNTKLDQQGIRALRQCAETPKDAGEPLVFRYSEDGSWLRCRSDEVSH